MDKQPTRGNWQRRSRYHAASGRNTHKPPSRGSKLTYWLLPMLLVFAIAVTRWMEQPLNKAPELSLPPGASYPEEPRIYTPDDLRAVIDRCADDKWGGETLDMAEVLVKSFIYWQKPEVCKGGIEAAVAYLTLLIQREHPDKAESETLETLAVFLGDTTPEGNADPQALERYRLALLNLHLALG